MVDEMNEVQEQELVMETKGNHWLLKVLVGIGVVQLLSMGATMINLNSAVSENSITIALNKDNQDSFNEFVLERFSRTPTRVEMELADDLVRAEIKVAKAANKHTVESLSRVAVAIVSAAKEREEIKQILLNDQRGRK